MYADNLLQIGFVSRPTLVMPWAQQIGQFVFNFGGIELATHKYLVLLEHDEVAYEASFRLSLRQRIDRILVLLALSHRLPQQGRDLAIRDWGEIKKMCTWRNHIAHNPVLPFWGMDQNPATDQPEGITMPNLQELQSGGGVHITLELLTQLVEVSANLFERLVETANTFPKCCWEQSGQNK